MEYLSKRQEKIIEFIRESDFVSNKQITAFLRKTEDNVSRFTVVRNLEFLIEKKIIKKEGKGRNVKYGLLVVNELLKYFNPKTYFEIAPDERKIKNERFNFGVFEYLTNEIFSKIELEELDKKNLTYRESIKKLPLAILKKEYERLMIELSWKSAQIEGNTYSLIDTEILLLENKEAVGHSKEEAVMLLNHKNALAYIFENKEKLRKISLVDIENVHNLIVQNLGVQGNIRKRPVGITGTRFRPLDNEYQIREAIENMLKVVNNEKMHPIAKALFLVLLISYIQPFEDGNKRTSRMLGNAALLAHGYCPLSYRSINEADYKKATLLFYEQNSALFFKELFVEQFKFAVDNYFLA